MPFITQGKTNWKFLSIIFILAAIVGGGILTYQWWPSKESKFLPQIKTEIIIYQKGEKTTLEQNSQHFSELQTACEEMLTSSNGALLELVTKDDIASIKNKENAIEIIYPEPREFKISFNQSTIKIDRMLIPLGENYVIYGYKEYSSGPLTSSEGTDKIENLLTIMSIVIEKDETANWQTYRNEEYWYEIKYPSDWEISTPSQWEDEYSYKRESYPSVDFFSKEDNIRFSIGVQTHWDVESEITEPSCVSQGEEIKVGAVSLYPIFSSFDWIGSGGHRIGFSEKECEELSLKNLISGEICVDKNLKEHANHCEPTKIPEDWGYTIDYPTDSTQYQFWLTCGDSWSGKDGRSQCLQLFSEILSTFKFIEKPYSIIYPETKTSGDKTEYTIDTARFEVIIKKELITEDPFSEEEPYTQYEWSFAAYNNGEKVYEQPMAETSPYSGGVFAFEYKNNKYISIGEYTGGAHCCTVDYIFMLNANNELKFLQTLNTDLGYQLVTKNGKIYLKMFDNSLRYFYTSYASGLSFEHYLLIEKDKLIPADIDFKEDYIKRADEAELIVENSLQEYKTQKEKGEKVELSLEGAEWFENLVRRTVNYLIIGQDFQAWDYFDKTYPQFAALSSKEIKNYQTIKNEIMKRAGF